VAVSDAGPVQIQPGSRRLSPARMLLIASPHFVLERIDLAANTGWALNTDRETWFLVLDGHAAIGLATASAGEALFIGDGRASIEVGADGFSGLIAYPGPDPIASLLQDLAAHSIKLTGVSVPQFAEIEVRS
jgi:mannose-6-phosphate isomerase